MELDSFKNINLQTKEKKMCEEEYTTIEVELDEKTLEWLEQISELTGFSMSKIIEYSLADLLIQEAVQTIKNR